MSHIARERSQAPGRVTAAADLAGRTNESAPELRGDLPGGTKPVVRVCRNDDARSDTTGLSAVLARRCMRDRTVGGA
jgi:hypothetical protein